MTGYEYHNLQAARIVAGTLTLLSREIHEVGPPASLWSPALSTEFIRETAARVSRGEALPLWVEERHPARGLAVYVPSPWESDFFGFGCAGLLGPFMVVEDQRDRENRVRKLARLAIEQGRREQRSLIALKTFHDPAVLRGFLAENFILAEIGAALSGPIPETDHSLERPAGFLFLEPEDLPDLTEEVVAGLGDFFYDGQFRHDPDLGPEAARRLWGQIAREDLSGRADPALVLWDRKKDRPVGLATVRILGQEAELAILAVSVHYRGRGLGRLILRETLKRLEGRANLLKVEAASYNLPALNLYQSLGLRLAAPLVALHRHLPYERSYER